jgi:antitoxin MazE
MNAKVQKWGNSLAIRIPKPFASELGLENDSEVEMVYSGGKLVISPVTVPHYSLGQLLENITADNIHDEVGFGRLEGREVW